MTCHFSGTKMLLLALFLTMSFQAQTCVSPPSGRVAWWPFDETCGTIAADVVGTKPAAYSGSRPRRRVTLPERCARN